MDTVQMREYLSNLYPQPKWKKRVAKMSDKGVMDFYRAKLELDDERRRARNHQGHVSEEQEMGNRSRSYA